jgi:hypothetical protein
MRSLIIGIVVICASLLPAQTVINGGRTIKGSWDASGAMSTKPAKTGATTPGTCSSGELFFKTNAPAGQNLYVCNPDNTWNHVTVDASNLSGIPQGNIGPVVFDGSSTSLADGSTVAWTCGTGSGAQCTTSWTVPAGANWVRVQIWGGGSGGGGSTAGSGSGSSGAGGGYQDMVCATTPGAAVSVAVGLGGIGSANWTAASGAGGNSTFGTCIAVTGGAAGGTYYSPWGGRIYGAGNAGWVAGTALLDNTLTYCRPGGSGMVAPTPVSVDQGGCGMQANDNLGWGCNASAGIAIGGGGGGGYGGWNNSCYGPGGTSALGGAGGHGGGWTSGGGLVACANGSIPGGGGGSAGAETAGGGNHTGCNGARGELRVYFAR